MKRKESKKKFEKNETERKKLKRDESLKKEKETGRTSSQ